MPPPRYTESKSGQKAQELGIGRPSTYAPTISTIQNRGMFRVKTMKIPYGQAQKGINVILKYCFFICHPDDHVGLELDCPIDSKILGYIGYRNLKLIRINEKKYIEIQKIIERRITRRIDLIGNGMKSRLNKYRILFSILLLGI